MNSKLVAAIRSRRLVSAIELQDTLQISQSTLSRLLAQNPQVAKIGNARATRYALRRDVNELGSDFHLFSVDESGNLSDRGDLISLEGGRWYGIDPIVGQNRIFDGLPYFLTDSVPQGFLGRLFPCRRLEYSNLRECSGQHADLLLPGKISDWSQAARRLKNDGWITASDADTMDVLFSFGRMIGNTDMHFGNISFLVTDDGLRLAPSYDQLPMMYAPAGEVIIDRGDVRKDSFDGSQAAMTALPIALDFWRQLELDPMVSDQFRQRAAQNHACLKSIGAEKTRRLHP